MSTKGFLLLIATVVAIGGSIGGAFSGGLALGRSQSGDAAPGIAVLPQFGGGQFSLDDLPSGLFSGSQLSGVTQDAQRSRPGGEAQTGQDQEALGHGT